VVKRVIHFHQMCNKCFLRGDGVWGIGGGTVGNVTCFVFYVSVASTVAAET
jgi:3-dehydroquinate synthetase